MNKNRTLEKLAFGTADVATIVPKFIVPTVEDVARHKTVVSQFFTPINDFLGKGKQIELPKFEDNITVTSGVGENTTISASSFSYDATTVNISKFGIRVEFNKEALQTATRDLLKDALYLAGKDYANEMDLRAETAMLGLSAGTITSWAGGTLGTVTVGQSPIVSITSVGAGTIDSIDYYDGKVLLASSVSAGTVTFTYSNNRYTKDSTNKGTLTLSDILNLKDSMSTDSTIEPDVLLVSTGDMTNLSTDSAFQNLFCCNSNKEYNCEVGSVLGIRVVSSGILPRGVAVLVDSERVGYDITTRKLTGYVDNKPEFDSVYYHLWAEKEYSMFDTLSVGLITNLATGAYSASDL